MESETVDWKSTEPLAFPIDVNAVLAHMRQDMRDDWFPDPLDYKDLFSNENYLGSVIIGLLLEGNGRYEGSNRTICDIPKKGLGIRYSLETDFYDRFIYQAICSYLIPFFDPLLSPRALGHRYNKKRAKEKYLFKPRIELWQTFEGVTHTALTGNQALLVTDVLNYFENISVETIRISFESMIPSIQANGPEKLRVRNAINSLCNLLIKWGYSDHHGLPQNRDPSSFIANVVLNSIDRRMVELGYDYYRYVDDIRIICPDINSARRALIELVGALRSVGMNINSSKTTILTSRSSPSDVVEFFPGSDDRSITIDNMWRTRSRRVIARSAQYIVNMLSECISSKATQSRQFRFAVNRLIQLIDANIFDIHSSLGNELLDLVIETLNEHPASTDQYCRLISALKPSSDCMVRISTFLCDHQSAIHPWQNYHLWLTLARHSFKSNDLLSFATERIQTHPTDSETSAIFIYLSCVGEEYRLIPVISRFDASWPNRNQRHFLLASRNLEQGELKGIVEKLSLKLKNTARRAAPFFNSTGQPLTQRNPPSIIDLYDEISAYD
ncbi:RNA-directed DNA polymerase [Sodalis ligni]|uniref:Reverse transcriptase (RNA-dependent DNA polymerase) n=1 Tax=Sodalis ligni TaxID=2697027 RepID=A0A4R1NRC5_9GAMM|nr:RNA-directed DNA polymerase [Sodalis ligni]TCL06980.1 reverse transcriptase (RNA-dependent DNA polymerase) [Sodalis ligni]